MTRILLTGATGMLAPFLHAQFSERGDIVGVARNPVKDVAVPCDLRDPDAVGALLDDCKPNLVLHLAALTNVDACQHSPVDAFNSNVRATANLVDAIEQRDLDTYFVYVSTDQVYDAPGPSSEDVVRPGNVYALTKLWGEDHARRLNSALVVRVNFYSGPGAGLVEWLVQKCRSGEPASLFTDVLFNPLHTRQLAQCLGELVDKRACGTLNLGASGGGLSKGAFLRAVAQTLELDQSGLRDGMVADLSLSAYRPRDMRMNIGRAEAVLGHSLPSIDDGLALLARDSDRTTD